MDPDPGDLPAPLGPTPPDHPDRTCSRCGTPLRAVAAFCPSCGHVTAARAREFRREARREGARAGTTVRALATVYVGVFAALLLSSWLGESPLGTDLLKHLLFVGVGCAAVLPAGTGALPASLPVAASPRSLFLGAAGALVLMGAAWAWVGWLDRLAEGAAVEPEEAMPLAAALLLSAVLPALVEEWLCRGVLWAALRPVAPPWTTILATAVLFAFLHGLGGGYLLEVPHRFAAGLALGWLRERTGGLAAPVLAHLLNNAFWVITG